MYNQSCNRIFGPCFRCSLDLSTLKSDLTHDLWLDLEGGAGKLHVLLTVSGLAQFDSIDGGGGGGGGDATTDDDEAASGRKASKGYGVSLGGFGGLETFFHEPEM